VARSSSIRSSLKATSRGTARAVRQSTSCAEAGGRGPRPSSRRRECFPAHHETRVERVLLLLHKCTCADHTEETVSVPATRATRAPRCPSEVGSS
jgi:hypothetical protein